MDLLFCFVFDMVLIFCDDFEWIFFVIFSGFLFFKEVVRVWVFVLFVGQAFKLSCVYLLSCWVCHISLIAFNFGSTLFTPWFSL